MTVLLFRYARSEAVGALLAISFVYCIAGMVAVNAIAQIVNNEYELQSVGMIYSAVGAVVFNIFLFVFLRGLGVGHTHSHGGHGHSHGHGHGHGHSHSHTRFHNEDDPSAAAAADDEDPSRQLNLRAATLHALGDICASSFVLVIALVIYKWPKLQVGLDH